MTWVKLDDTAPMHPKLLKLSDGALRLWIHGLAFANRGVTDGKIDKALVASLNHHGRWSPKQLAGFVSELSACLWIDRGDHYEIHDYAHHQAEALKERVERKRELDRARQQKKREREDDRARESLGMSRRDMVRDATRESRRETSVPSRPVPTRPDPSPDGDVPHEAPPPPSASDPVDRMLASLTPVNAAERETIRMISETRVAAGGAPWVATGHHDRDAALKLTRWASDPAIGPKRLAEALASFWAVKGTAARLSWMTDEDPGRWLGKVAPKTRQHRAAKPNDAYTTDLSDLERWGIR